MPYKTVKREKKVPGGTRTIYTMEWYEVPQKHTIASLLGNSNVVKEVVNESILYEYHGEVYQDVPAEMIKKIDEALWNGNVEYANRAFAMVKKVRQKVETIKELNNADVAEKGEKIMEYNNFRSIFTALKEVYADSKAQGAKVCNEWEEAQKTWNRIKNNLSVGAKEKLLAEADYVRAEDEFKKEYNNLVLSVESRVAELKKTLEDAVAVHYKVKPGRVDSKALELLRLGILKDKDILQLAQDNEGNFTMLSVIKKYAGDRKSSAEMQALAIKIERELDTEKEINAFNTLCEYGARSYTTDTIKRNTFEKIFDSLFDNAIENTSDVAFDNVEVVNEDE